MRAEKAGHTGTLDPLATGVLPICFGSATKFSHIHLDAIKTYDATVKLGEKTSTGDAEGEVIDRQEVTEAMTVGPSLARACQAYTGEILQIPPMTSALKKEGVPLYELARQGIEVERAARSVVIHQLQLERINNLEIKLSVTCSKGTYIRVLGEDIAQLLGTCGHLTRLRRLATGDFSIAKAVTLPALEAMQESERQALLMPVDELLSSYLRVDLDNDSAGRFLSGVRRKTEQKDCGLVKAYGPGNQLLGSAHILAGELIPTRLLSPIDIEQIQQSVH
jgi:tRNA pseudouridine55 synthase